MAAQELAGVAIAPILRCALWRLTPECGLGIGTVQRKATLVLRRSGTPRRKGNALANSRP